MNFIQSISTCMRKYVNFSGRATRSEFWWFYLFTVLVNLVATSQASSFVPTLLDGQDMTENESSYFLNNFFFLYLSTITSLILLLPSLAVAVRRLHDVGRSGWWILIAFTVIGIIPLLIWYVTDTKDEENIYGPNPKTEDN
ncbi:MAG: aminopeptidase [Rhodobacterales bacterium]|nr:MAG: aminopeptidase [Rhodobacterales bacterium]